MNFTHGQISLSHNKMALNDVHILEIALQGEGIRLISSQVNDKWNVA